jgi:flagellar hook protein FlgE
MALTSTLFTGLSGLDVNQTRLNVVGNNIANVNTVGFKASRALFKPQFYVTDSGGSPPSGDAGGQNPDQRGLGAAVGSIEKDWSPGSIEPTGRQTDLAVDGDGFFIVRGQEQMYTRDGSFSLDSRNNLVTSDGQYVQGFGVDDQENILAGQLNDVNIPIGGLTKAEATRNAFLSGNLNAAGDLSSGASVLNSNAELFTGGGPVTGATLLTAVEDAAAVPMFAVGDVLELEGSRGGRRQTPLSMEVEATTTVAELNDFLAQGLGIASGIAQPSTATSGGGLKAGPTTGSQLVLVGNTGAGNAVSIEGSDLTINGSPLFGFAGGETAGGIQDDPAGETIHTSMIAYDSLGQPLRVDVTMNLEATTNDGTQWRFIATTADDSDYTDFNAGSAGQVAGVGTVEFDTNGRLIQTNNGTLTVNRQNTGAEPNVDISLDFSKVTSLADGNSEFFAQQDGTKIGTLVGFGIGQDGSITGSFDNGLTGLLGQVGLATFDNPQGLSDNGNSLYAVGSNSGEPRIGAPLEGLAGGIRSGALELSNVDLSGEFINLIIASTGFSAASRVISTSDELMTELLNTSR